MRHHFPVLEKIAYLNAGTDGPVPRPAADAATEAIARETADGRSGKSHFERLLANRDEIRRKAAALMDCDPSCVALTHSTTDGMNLVLRGVGLEPGDEVITSDEEHPGLLAPLAALERTGVVVRQVPFAELPGEVSPATRLIAVSHVSWIGGKVADLEALRSTGIQLLLDGAQGLGAIPVKPAELGCNFYAAAGQKWLCGPDSTGFLYVGADCVDRLGAPWPGYQSLSEPARAEELPLHPGAARFDMGFPTGPSSAWTLASLNVLEEMGFDELTTRGPTLAAKLADELGNNGFEVAPRGHSTLVSWEDTDSAATVERLATAGVVVRDLPGKNLVRASVGAWSNEDDLERLMNALTSKS